MFLLSNFHLIFILISFSFLCHPHHHLTVGTLVLSPPSGVCVCVEHLNRCKTSSWSYSKQGACGCHANACQRSYAWQWKHSLINCVYLQFFNWFELQSISERWTLDVFVQSGLYFAFPIYILDISRSTSQRTLYYLYLSITNLILLAWDSVPYRSYEGSILV